MPAATAQGQTRPHLVLTGAGLVSVLLIAAYFIGGGREEKAKPQTPEAPFAGSEITFVPPSLPGPGPDLDALDDDLPSDGAESVPLGATPPMADTTPGSSPAQPTLNPTESLVPLAPGGGAATPLGLAQNDPRPPEPSPSPAPPSPITAQKNRPVPVPAPVATVMAGTSTTPSPGKPRTRVPVLIRPQKPRAGVVGHTRSLVAEHEIPESMKPGKAPVEKSMPGTPPRAALVTKPQAEAVAAAFTETLRQERRIPPTQHLRLPRTNETRTTTLWRQEDQPASAGETRPFGLVLVEDTTDQRAPVTPEGIPLKTPTPGQSPLEKTGADTPLWKRPGS